MRRLLILYMNLIVLKMDGNRGKLITKFFLPPFSWFLARVQRLYIMTMLPEGINKLAKAIILFVCLPRSIDPLSIYAKVVTQMQPVQLSSNTSARWLLQMWESVWRQRPFSYTFSSEDFRHLSWWECVWPGWDASMLGEGEAPGKLRAVTWICEYNWKNIPCIWALERVK